MAGKCNCAGNTCACSIIDGEGTVVQGVGTAGNPFRVNVDLTALVLNTRIEVDDTTDINLTMLGSGTEADPIVLSAVLVAPAQVKPAFVRKTADQNVISSVALVAAADLLVPVADSKRYLIEGQLFYTAAAAGDIKVGITAPAGATIDWTMAGLPLAAATADDPIVGSSVAAVGATHSRGGVAAKVAAEIKGVLNVAATPGNLGLTFAQNTSTATNTTLHAGSWLRATLLD